MTESISKSAGAGRHEVPRWVWLYLPFAVLSSVVAARLSIPDIYVYEDWVESERGIVENATAVALFPAIALGIRGLGYRAVLPAGWLTAWLLLLTAAAVFFAGEEISWGQQWFGWATPEPVAVLNQQGEFNLHNMGKQLTSRTPKFLAGLVVVLGGIAFPLWRRWRGIAYTDRADWRYWVAPTRAVVPAAALMLGLRIVDRVADWLGFGGAAPLDIDFGELQEFYIALFLTLYVYAMFRRLRADAAD